MAKRTYILKDYISVNNAFDSLINKSNNIRPLPLTHKKGWRDAEKILNAGVIPLESCDVFGNQLQYYFYGRPAYVVGQGAGNRRDHVYLPVCFIIDSDKLSIDNVFPFDSGAYANELYDDYIDKSIDINSFQISPEISSIKGFIEYFYKSNEKYYKHKPRHLNLSADLPPEVFAYINLLSASGTTKFDIRADTIEIISKEEYNLKDGLKAIVIPNEFAYAKTTRVAIEKLKNNGVEIITYQMIGYGPEQYNAVISQKVYEYLFEKECY